MQRLLSAALLSLALITSAFAQSGTSVKQAGASVTPNSVPYWVTNGVIGGTATAADSPITSFGVTTATQLGNCVNSARSSSTGWIGLCQGFVSGVPTISVQNYGSATAQPLQFIVNGTTYSFPGALAGITINSTTVTGGTNGDCLNITSGNVGEVPCSILSAGTTGTGAVVLQNSPTLVGTIGGSLSFSGNETFTGNVTMGSELTVNGIGTPASASGNTVLLGTVTAPTLTNTGQAYLFNTATTGANLQGDGSAQDVVILNKNGAAVMEVATGTTGVTFPGVLTLSGLSSGSCAASVLLDSSNRTISGSCPGAASSIQVGTTSVLTGTTGYLLYDNAGTLGDETIASILTPGTGISVTGTTNATIATNLSEGTGITLSGTAPQTIALSTITGPGVLGSKTNGAGQTVGTVQTPVLLETLTPSGSASFASSVSWAGYSSIKLVFKNVTFSTSLNLIAQLHSSGAYQSTGYAGGVTYTQTNSGSGGAFGTTTANLTTGIYVVTSGLSSSAFQISGELQLFNIGGSQYKQVTGMMTANNATTAYVFWAGAAWTVSGAVDGIQFNTSTGTVSGSVEIWGIP